MIPSLDWERSAHDEAKQDSSIGGRRRLAPKSSYKLGYKVATDNLTGLITVPSYWNKSTSLPDICDSGEGCPNVYDAENYYWEH